MRLDNTVHQQQNWWVHDYARDFELLDLWQYPIEAERAEDFETFHELHDMKAMVAETSILVRALFGLRLALGKIFGWDNDQGIGFYEVFRDPREQVLRIENKTVTALMHLGWVQKPNHTWTAQMAVFVLPRGRLGRWYMRAIAPFRHRIVYPALMRAGKRRWTRSQRPSREARSGLQGGQS